MILIHGIGITQPDLMILEDHVVYSVTKEKEAVQFYIMQCTNLVKEDVVQLPIKDVIDRFYSQTALSYFFFSTYQPIKNASADHFSLDTLIFWVNVHSITFFPN